MELKIKIDDIEIDLKINFKESDKGICISGLDVINTDERAINENEKE